MIVPIFRPHLGRTATVFSCLTTYRSALGLALVGGERSPSPRSSALRASSSSPLGSLDSLASLASHASAYAASRGILVGRPDASYVPAPVSLLPNVLPLPAFRRATEDLPVPFGRLVEGVSRDVAFLDRVLGGDVSRHDPFTARLLAIYRDLYGPDAGESGRWARDADRLGILRSDYMLHAEESGGTSLKQVELNTVASSFAGLAARVSEMHRHLLRRFPVATQAWLRAAGATSGEIPPNPALENLAAALALAHRRHAARTGASDAAVLFVVQPGESNAVDQRLLELALADGHDVPVLRRSLGELAEEAALCEDTGAVTVDGRECAVVYFRAGYTPDDLPTEKEWGARVTLEKSRAAKCPCLGHHLAGTKKVQQELARPGTTERFVKSADAAMLRTAFADLHGLEEGEMGEADREVLRSILDQGAAERYVLKPQREGGGHNYYGEALAAMIQDHVERDVDGTVRTRSALGEFILMQRLFPPAQEAVLLREGKVEGRGPSVSELGCFSTVLADGKGEIVHNEYAGYLLRTKFLGVDEGGVASGFATLSSPYVC